MKNKIISGTALVFGVLMATAGAAWAAPVLVLGWSDNSDNEAGFAIERAAGSGPDFAWAEIARVPANVNTYADRDLLPAATYSYRVRAYNAAGFSDYSNTASATTLPDVPAAPGGLAVPDQPAVVVIDNDVRINGNLVVAGTITAQAAATEGGAP